MLEKRESLALRFPPWRWWWWHAYGGHVQQPPISPDQLDSPSLSLAPQTPQTRVSTWVFEVLTGKSLWGGMDGSHTSVFLKTSDRQENPATHCIWPASLSIQTRLSPLSFSLIPLPKPTRESGHPLHTSFLRWFRPIPSLNGMADFSWY